MKKGISTIIAVVLMLIITISLVGTAYMFISGMLGARISQTIEMFADCEDGKLILIVYNKGTDTISNIDTATGQDDLKIYINNGDKTNFFEENGVTDDKAYDIEPHGNTVIISNDTYTGQQ